MKRHLSTSFRIIFSLLLLGFQTYARDAAFTAQDYKERREKLAALIPDGVAILDGRSCPYFTGIDSGDVKLILVPASIAEKTPAPSAWKTTLYLPSKSPQAGVWDDPKPCFGSDTLALCGIENNAPDSAFSADAARLANITDAIYIPYRPAAGPSAELPRDLAFVDSIRKILPSVRIKNLGPLIDQLRWKKSAKEIEIMRKACAITVDAFKEAASKTKPGVFEYEVEATVNYVFRKNDGRAEFLIIGSGPNSCILHHMSNKRQMLKDEVVVIDIGVEYGSMGTDLTRTIPVSGSFTPEQRKIYDIVLEAQKKAISIVKPGVTLTQVHRAAFEVIEKAGYAKYFIHGASHTLNGGSSVNPQTDGLFVPQKHDNRYFANDTALAQGSMFTVEPGIYIPEKNLGVRIEDSVLVTDIGAEVLTGDAPKEAKEIEILVGGKE